MTLFLAVVLTAATPNQMFFYNQPGTAGVIIQPGGVAVGEDGIALTKASYTLFAVEPGGRRTIDYGICQGGPSPAHVVVSNDGNSWAMLSNGQAGRTAPIFEVYSEKKLVGAYSTPDLFGPERSAMLPNSFDWRDSTVLVADGDTVNVYWLSHEGVKLPDGNTAGYPVGFPGSMSAKFGGGQPVVGATVPNFDTERIANYLTPDLSSTSRNRRAYAIMRLGATGGEFPLRALLANPVTADDENFYPMYVAAVLRASRRVDVRSPLRPQAMRIVAAGAGEISDLNAIIALLEDISLTQDPSMAPAAAEFLGHRDPKIRVGALSALSRTDMLSALEAGRVAVLRDGDPSVRHRAREILMGGTRLAEGEAVGDLLISSLRHEISAEGANSPWAAHAAGCLLAHQPQDLLMETMAEWAVERPEYATPIRNFIDGYEDRDPTVYPENRVTRMLGRVQHVLTGRQGTYVVQLFPRA